MFEFDYDDILSDYEDNDDSEKIVEDDISFYSCKGEYISVYPKIPSNSTAIAPSTIRGKEGGKRVFLEFLVSKGKESIKVNGRESEVEQVVIL